MPEAREVMVWKYGRQAEWNTELLSGVREDGTMETGSSGKMYGLFWIGDPETMTGGRGRVVARSRHSMGGGGMVGVRGCWLLAFFSFGSPACWFQRRPPTNKCKGEKDGRKNKKKRRQLSVGWQEENNKRRDEGQSWTDCWAWR